MRKNTKPRKSKHPSHRSAAKPRALAVIAPKPQPEKIYSRIWP